MPTISSIVSLYPLAQYLCQVDIAKKGLFGGGINNSLPNKIYNIGKSVKRIFDDDPTNDTLAETADYLWALCGKWGLQAQVVAQNAGSIAAISPTGVSLPLPLDFVVSGSSIIATGETTINLASFVGFNLEFTRNGITQNTTNDGSGNSYYTWDRTTGDFTLSVAAQEGELFRIVPIG